ncbi:MAG: MFS transporter [SAR202 cluster bacterium]|nr:MFS transporter [SAR202 cluster bacterium]MQF93166.1 MFS transporter [SAR202 cluster bacterium]|tara:strand:+ start:6100 stop:7827 length:1728 start_codon:yes stop_codon:yes gene_type:complete
MFRNLFKNKDSLESLDPEKRKAITGWCMYDWANSAFFTSAGTAIFPIYFVVAFQATFGSRTEFLGITFTGSSLWALGVSMSALFVALSSPILGAIADTKPLKKTFLKYYMIIGSLFTIISFFSVYVANSWAWLIGCYFIANIGAAGANVFYNSLLPSLAPSKYASEISTKGYAYGYIGGGLLLLVHLIFIQGASIYLDDSAVDLVTRLCIVSVGIWWFGWSIWTLKTVPEPEIENNLQNESFSKIILSAFSRLRQTFSEIRKFKYLFTFLIAFYIFNDGVQTVLSVAGAYGADVLGVQLIFNMITILIIQFVAAPGSILFGWLADKYGTKEALVIALTGWIVIIVFVLGFAPLKLTNDKDYDYQFAFDSNSNNYELISSIEFSSTEENIDVINWEEKFHKLQGQKVSEKELKKFINIVQNEPTSSYSVVVTGGQLDSSRIISKNHASSLSDGWIDAWPAFLRDVLWQPLNIQIGFQWMTLGLLSGLVLGGSQALARACFSMMTPVKKSAEFFGFYAFTMKASSVIGPLIYVIAVNTSNQKLGVLIIWALIVIGTIYLSTIDVRKGALVADEENKK